MLDRTLDCKASQNKNYSDDEDSVDSYDADQHPLATLHMENFIKIGNMFGESWYRDIEGREVVFAKRDREQVRRLSLNQELLLKPV